MAPTIIINDGRFSAKEHKRNFFIFFIKIVKYLHTHFGPTSRFPWHRNRGRLPPYNCTGQNVALDSHVWLTLTWCPRAAAPPARNSPDRRWYLFHDRQMSRPRVGHVAPKKQHTQRGHCRQRCRIGCVPTKWPADPLRKSMLLHRFPRIPVPLLCTNKFRLFPALRWRWDWPWCQQPSRMRVKK